MATIETPKNQWALAVRLLIENKENGLTVADATRTDLFYKFSNRLAEVIAGRESKIKVEKKWVNFTNRFKHQGTHLNYKSKASNTYLNNLIKKLNREGRKAINYKTDN